MKKQKIKLLLLLFLGLFVTDMAAQKLVEGTVSSTDGELLPGVSVVLKGTITGVSTDFDGNYSIEVPGNDAVLVFSYLGMETKEVTVGDQTTLNVLLEMSSEALDEVVVTALGISREKKSLGYSVAEVDGDDVTTVTQENALNALNGRVAGVQINSTGGTGSTVSVVLRGASSLTTDNQPLYVIDGVPLTSGLTNIGTMGSGIAVDYGGGIGDINPDDIANVSVLKGPSAAALYGSRGANGVIMITTKSGSKSKGLGITFTSSNVYETPYKFLEKSTRFANGSRPDPNTTQIDETSSGWVGPELDKGLSAIQWPYTDEEIASGVGIATPLISRGANNAKNFFESAYTLTNTIAIENNTDRMNYRLSYTNMKHEGFIPNSDLHRNNFGINSTFDVNDKLRITSSLKYTISGADNRPSTTERNANPLQALYDINPHIDIRDLRDYWLVEGQTQNAPYNFGDDPSDFEYNNPYFMAYEINNGFERKRLMGNIQADYKFTDKLSLMVRYAYNDSHEERETKISSGFSREMNGAYGLQHLNGVESNADFLLSYTDRLSDSFDFGLSGGGNIRNVSNSFVSTQTKNGGAGLIIPNLFLLSNIASDNIDYTETRSKERVNSLYALGNIGYKDMVYVDATLRNDWSSTLPEAENSFLYPSVSTSILVNNMFDMGNNVSLFKLRVGWAQAGNDTSPHNLYAILSNSGDWGAASQLTVSEALKNDKIKAELNTSTEYGVDLSLFKNRLNMDFTYYESNNENQIFQKSLPISSGATSKLFNAGNLNSKGFEASLGGVLIDGPDLRWNMNLTYTTNKTIITELAEGTDYVNFWSQAKGGAYTWVGEEVGQIVDRAFVRVEDVNSPYYGWPLLDDEGWENSDSTLSDEDGNRVAPVIGNYNPDFKMGLQTSIQYKNWNLSMNFDWRKGGQFVSQTYRYMESDLQSTRWLDKVYDLSDVGDIPTYIKENADVFLSPDGDFYPLVGGPTAEDGGFPVDDLNDGVFLPGVIGYYDENGNFIAEQENIGGPGTQYHTYGDNYAWDFTRASTFDADYVKLRQISIGYTFPGKVSEKLGMRNLSLSLFSRNIILWTKAKINIDPESAFQYSNGNLSQGVERYNIQPWAIPVGIKLNASF
ncbi:SusC/RagA family TonB-linked outer membrane protein [Pseudozobellia thermophila]|uniref:TonB-linked outer membrane protein, SusC/RagA family n=1 Tax=Pseudozobellia thermophila TaxID=192903 RepID=A0A1M6I3F9_9FLAO|nr:SusC/RagA family TonB-linked outer membrane protein [Pseudozobellia thermophila]SHJ29021.1 TonB-linked outer membrane protein, SusC/RagA family [Pseudozobellia thermophila]